MVEGDHHIARQQRFLHEIIVGRAGVHMRPERLELRPHGFGFRTLESRDHATREGRVEIALEETRHQPAGAGRETQRAFSRLGLDVRGPFAQLHIGQRVDIGPGREILQRFLLGGHHVGRLHPRNILLLVRAELAEGDEVVGDARCARRRHEIIHGVEARGHQRLDFAMQRAEQRYVRLPAFVSASTRTVKAAGSSTA